MATRDERELVIELLKTAIAALGEEIVELGAHSMPKGRRRQVDVIGKLQDLARDASILSAACRIFIARADLFGSTSE